MTNALDGVDALAHALHYVSLGWKVVPLRPHSKAPLPDDWPDLALDEAGIHEWWGRGDAIGIGIICGRTSGIFVLDVDPRHGGDDTLATLEAHHGPLPTTVEAITGGGGRHLIFRYPPDAGAAIANSKGRLGPGLDIKSDRGQIVAAPTVHPDTGVRYEWEVSSRPGEVAIADAPAWMLKLIHEPVVVLPEGQGDAVYDTTFAVDHFNSVHDNEAVARRLEERGFHSRRVDRDGVIYLTRPGKADGSVSVSVGKVAPGVTFCFTSSVPQLDEERGYKPFDLYAAFTYGGDRVAADQALVDAGWGHPTWAIDERELDAWVAGESAKAKAVARVLDRDGPDDVDGRGALFRRWTMAELANSDLTLRWLLKSMLCNPTYGQIAGEMKTLKSYIAGMLAMSVATGKPLLERFPVETPGDVLFYVGEGGRVPWTRRMRRIADAYEVDMAEVGIHPSFDVAPIPTKRFQGSLERDLDEVHPALFILDPLYTYHGTQSSAANLHEEGALLSSLSAPCMDRGVSLLIVNHFNQTGAGGGLKRITMAGSGEWADTWVLLSHREIPKVAEGRFFLRMDVGSRQWGGLEWDIDLSIGRLDPETGMHDGVLSWEIRPADNGGGDGSIARILGAVGDAPGEHTKEDLAKLAGGRLTETRGIVEKLTNEGLIVPKIVEGRRSDGRSTRIWRYFPAEGGTTHETALGSNVPFGTTDD